MDEFDKTLFALIKRSHPNAKDDEILDWMKSSSEWAAENNRLMRRWMIDIQILLRKELDALPVDKFFVRLNGILVDIPAYIGPNLKVYRQVIPLR